MAEFQKIVKERKRMCEQYDFCKYCPLGELQKKHGNENATCRSLAFDYPEEAERIIMQWASEHPVMTNGKKFEQVFGFTPYMKFRSYENMKQWVESKYEGND